MFVLNSATRQRRILYLYLFIRGNCALEPLCHKLRWLIAFVYSCILVFALKVAIVQHAINYLDLFSMNHFKTRQTLPSVVCD